MSLSLALSLFKLIAATITWFEQQTWYQQGKAAADAEANAEQAKRIVEANAARADTDAYAGGVRNDPDRRD